jgi:hypothetical protein
VLSRHVHEGFVTTKKRVVFAAVVLGAIAAAGTMVAPESATWATSGDVMYYLGTAETLVRDGRFAAPAGNWERVGDSLVVPSHYPPGFALALSLPLRLGANTDVAARIVRATGAGATICLAVLFVASLASLWAGVLAGVLIMVSPGVVFTHTIAFSEPLFIPFVLATVACMTLWPDRPLWYGLTAAVALHVRLIGIALSGGVAVWAAAFPGTLMERVRRASLAILPSMIVQLGWTAFLLLHHSHDGRRFGYYGPVLPLLRQLAGANSVWLAPYLGDGPLRIVAKVVMTVTILFACAGSLRWLPRSTRQPNRSSDEQRRLHRFFVAVGLVFLCYNAVYFFARLLVEWGNVFEVRNFATVEVLFSITLACAIGLWWARGALPSRSVVGLFVGLWIVAAAANSVQVLRDAEHETAEWRTLQASSPLLEWIRRKGRNREIYTNYAAMVWRGDGLRSRDLPLLFDPDTITALGAALTQTQGILVWWRDRKPIFQVKPEDMPRYARPDRIAQFLRLSPLAQFDEGIVWGPPAVDPQRDNQASGTN